MRYAWSLVVLVFLLGNSSVFAQDRKGDWVWGGEIDPLQSKFEVQHYNIDLAIDPERQTLNGKVSVQFTSKTPLDTLRLNLIDLYTVSLVSMDNTFLSYNHYGDTLDILLPGNENIDSEVTIYYEGITPLAIRAPWKGGFVWTKDSAGHHWMGFACQGEGAKIFMPCLDHPSSEPWQGVDLKITVPHPYFIAANGRLLSATDEKGGIQYHWKTNYPINNYLINFTMGKFHMEEKLFTSVSGRKVPMAVYVLEENKEKADDLLSVLERSAETQEKFFGPFPFPNDKIAVVETPYLGMEHQTINAYGNKFNFTELDGKPHDWLLHHELGHEWWGNMVTVSDWSHFWIHEGICTYGDWLFYLEHGGEKAYLDHVAGYASSIMNLKPIVSGENVNSDDSYHIEVYYKGAFIMHSLRFLLGDETFFDMLRSFLHSEKFTYEQHVSTKDFISFVQGYSDRNLEGFFQMYLYTTDVPKVVVKESGDQYAITIPNIDFTLPIEIQTSQGIIKKEVGSEPVTISSKSTISIDPHHWFLLEVVKIE